MKVPVYNQQGEKAGEIELNSKMFEVKPNEHLMAESVRVIQSNSRGGLAHTKTRGDVRGGGKKPWKQKGTGRARAGSTRSPLWRHGGITFGPRSNRNWELKINKKAKTQALFMSLSDKAKHEKLVVVDQITLDPVKTKTFIAILDKLKTAGASGKKHLVLMAGKDAHLERASRNVPGVSSQKAAQLSILDVLKADSLIVLKDSLSVLEKTFLKEAKKK